MDRSIKLEVNLGNNEIVEVSGKGTINVITKHGKKFISDVYFVHSLKHNLISVGNLVKTVIELFLRVNVCTIFDTPPSNLVIARVEMKNNRIFPLLMKSNMVDEIVASFKATSQD